MQAIGGGYASYADGTIFQMIPEIDDPIPYPETAGIVVNVENGKYYSYKGKIYLAKADMPNCVYPPDTPSLWQWEEVNSGEG